jgi:formate hydrogenlyase regulatory protein HycA
MVSAMAVPEVIPIAYEPHGRTEAIGRYADGQFMGSVTYAFPKGFELDTGWEDHKRLYSVLHTFDADGRYRDSEIWCAGTWAEQQRTPHGPDSVLSRARAHLATLLRSLPRRTYTDIAIRPFQLTVQGVLFGLVTGEDEGEPWAELYPEYLGFGPPWDGTYDT